MENLVSEALRCHVAERTYHCHIDADRPRWIPDAIHNTRQGLRLESGQEVLTHRWAVVVEYLRRAKLLHILEILKRSRSDDLVTSGNGQLDCRATRKGQRGNESCRVYMCALTGVAVNTGGTTPDE